MEKINKKLKELFAKTSFENYQFEGFDSADELIDSLREEIKNEEVIYYSNAMEYLSKNDNSLLESLGIAYELGYKTNKINSELLATLLLQQNLDQELNELISQIEEIYSEV